MQHLQHLDQLEADALGKQIDVLRKQIALRKQIDALRKQKLTLLEERPERLQKPKRKELKVGISKAKKVELEALGSRIAEDAGSSWTSLGGTNNRCKQPKRKSKELKVISKAKQVETDGQVAAIPPKCLNLVDGKALGSNWVSCSHCCLEWPQWDVGTVCPYCCKQLGTV